MAASINPSSPSTPVAAPSRRLVERLFDRVDISSLVFFRIAFGAIMMWEVTRYYGYGWVRAYWVEPTYNFPYPFFEWVRPWPGQGMYFHFIFMGAMAFSVMVGLMYRVSAVLLWLSFTYVFLLEEARYLNHFYLVSLLAFLIILVPAHRGFSVDARFNPALRSSTAPAWALWILRFQVGIPYFFGGVAKLNHDWMNGTPMHYWLLQRDDFPVIGHLFHHPFAAYFFSWSGALIDLVAVPLLLWKRTRIWMFAVLVSFHFTNTRLFNIGIFPWTMLAATTIFFPPDWPRRLLGDLRGVSWRSIAAVTGALLGAVTATAFRGEVTFVPGVVGALSGMVLAWGLFPAMNSPDAVPTWPESGRLPALGRRAIVAGLGLWVAVQVLVPLRHYAIPGVVHWTEEGHRFSWHMKLRGKDGQIAFVAHNPFDGTSREIDLLQDLQRWQIDKMSTRPYMIRQYAHRIADLLREEGWAEVEVYADSRVGLNGRRPQVMIDGSVDLASVGIRYMAHNDWITHLTTPLPKR